MKSLSTKTAAESQKLVRLKQPVEADALSSDPATQRPVGPDAMRDSAGRPTAPGDSFEKSKVERTAKQIKRRP